MTLRIGFFGGRGGGLGSTMPVLVVLVLASSGCVTYIPADEYNLARAAFEAAREVEAPRFAPALWFKAEQAYREGQKFYKDRNYEAARASFIQSKAYSEQAENAARIDRVKSGDIAP